MDNIILFHSIRPSVAKFITRHWHDIHKPINELTPEQGAAFIIIDNALREILQELAIGVLSDAAKRQNRQEGGAQ